jgi:hypothetical protein
MLVSRGVNGATECIVESIFVVPSARIRHESAPLWQERERYLIHLLRQGRSHSYVRSTAAMLLQVVRLLDLSEMRTVQRGEIEEAAKRWREDSDYHLTRQPGHRSREVFSGRAHNWLSLMSMQ